MTRARQKNFLHKKYFLHILAFSEAKKNISKFSKKQKIFEAFLNFIICYLSILNFLLCKQKNTLECE